MKLKFFTMPAAVAALAMSTVSISTKGTAVSKLANSSSQSYDFTVLGLNSGQVYTRELLCTGSVTNCNSPTQSTFTAQQYGMTITVNFTTSAPLTTGRVRLWVHGGSPNSQDSGWINVTARSQNAVAVTPDNGTAPQRFQNTGGYTEVFTVTNTGLNANTFAFSCTGANGVTCGTTPGSRQIPGGNGDTAKVNMPYSVGAAGSGTLTLTASGGGGGDPGSYSVPIVTAGGTVDRRKQITSPRPATPICCAKPAAVPFTRQH